MNDIVESMHKRLDIAAKYLWFYNKPEIELTVVDGELYTYLKMVHMESQLKLKEYTKGVLYDPLLSGFLNAHVYYLGKRSKEHISNAISKEFNLFTGEEAIYLKLHVRSETFIIANNNPKANNKLLNNCRETQIDYFSKHFNDSAYKEWWAYLIFCEIYRGG